jgi:hypothetical protein
MVLTPPVCPEIKDVMEDRHWPAPARLPLLAAFLPRDTSSRLWLLWPRVIIIIVIIGPACLHSAELGLDPIEGSYFFHA